MEVAVHLNRRLAPGTVALPAGIPEVTGLRVGSVHVPVAPTATTAAHRLELASDLWERLSLPYQGIRLELHPGAGGEAELGPAVAMLYAGRPGSVSRATAEERVTLFFGHHAQRSGLFALGFDESIDWERGVMTGYVMDTRPGREGQAVATRFPIPRALHLRWAIRKDAIDRLRALTGDRVFNWVRNMSKWEFHGLLAAELDLAPYLPETRLLRSHVDLAAMLVKHGEVYVKHVFGIQGRANARVRQVGGGFHITRIEQGRPVECTVADLGSLRATLREVLGPGRLVVQEGLALHGVKGRKLDFRVLVTPTAEGGWRCLFAHAKVAGDSETPFTNVSNGAQDADMVAALTEHHGLAPAQAAAEAARMVQLCLRAAPLLDQAYHPLGLLGFDVAREADSGRILLLEANTVPGWGYPWEVEQELARAMTDFACHLAQADA